MNLYDEIDCNRLKIERLEEKRKKLIIDKENMITVYDDEIKNLTSQIESLEKENNILSSDLEFELKEKLKLNRKYNEYLKSSKKLNKVKK